MNMPAEIGVHLNSYRWPAARHGSRVGTGALAGVSLGDIEGCPDGAVDAVQRGAGLLDRRSAPRRSGLA